MLILLLFFCSGAAALVYEVLWSKYLSWILGSTVQAQTVVLAVFFGGLAIGNRLFGHRSARIQNPLLAYGVLEMIIAVYAFSFPFLYEAGDWVFIKLGAPIMQYSFVLLALKLSLSVVLLLLPTVLMGGTLPLIAAWIERQPGFESGARVGIFYATNSLGAVFGAGMAGFVLVQNFGMVSSLELTALFNFAVGVVAAVLSKRGAEARPIPAELRASKPSPAPMAGGRTWFIFLVALTGGVSMGLEILSARTLALIAGGSLQAFALVLMSFILGIGLGSIAISNSEAARRFGATTICFLLLAAATIVILNVVFIEEWTMLYSRAKYGLARNESGYVWHQVGVALMSFLLLGIPAALLGSVVPLSIRLLQGEGLELGDQVGRLLTANTIGAVVGVLLTGFVLMPLIGLRGAFTLLAILLMAAAAMISFRHRQRQITAGAIALIILGISSVSSTGENWRHAVGGGIFRIRDSYVGREWVNLRRSELEIIYYKDSADATVAVERLMKTNPPALSLRVNGKTDASTFGELATQHLCAHLPLMFKPDAKKVFLLGFGSGIAAGAVLGHPIEQLTIAENCGPVLEAGKFFAPWNRGVLTNSRTRIFEEDARAVLKLHPDKYDVIINVPSNPWVAGIASVFSKEYYELCASRLNEGGIVAQWFHKYEMSDHIQFMVLRTFSRTFPHMEVWDTQYGDIIMLGSKTPWESTPAQFANLFSRAEPRRDMQMLGYTSPLPLWARQLASQRTAAAIPGDGPEQSDEFPILEYAAPKAFFIGREAERLYYFDERTLQFPLSARAKIDALRAIPDPALVDSFTYPSSNRDVMLYVEALRNREFGGMQRLDPMGHIVFRDPASFPETPPIRPGVTPEAEECVKLEARILRDNESWREAGRRIEEILISLVRSNNLRPRDFSPTYYAALVARFAIGADDYVTALRMLQLGAIFSVEDEQIQFLSRVVDRIMPPDLLENLRERDSLNPATGQNPPG